MKFKCIVNLKWFFFFASFDQITFFDSIYGFIAINDFVQSVSI